MQQTAREKLSGMIDQQDPQEEHASEAVPTSVPSTAASETAELAAAADSRQSPIAFQQEVVIAEVLEPSQAATRGGGDVSAPQPSANDDAAELQHAELELQNNWQRLQKRWQHFVERPLSPVPSELQPVSAQAGGSSTSGSSEAATPPLPLISQFMNRVLQVALIGAFAAQWAPVASAVTSGAVPLDRNTLLGVLLACPGTPFTEAWQLVSRRGQGGAVGDLRSYASMAALR